MTSRAPALFLACVVAGCTAGAPAEIRPIDKDYPHLTPFEAAYAEGKRQLGLDRPGVAVMMFEKALSLDPNSINALNGAGAALDELNSPDLAAPYYAKALALDPRNTDTINNMGVSAIIAGRPSEARALFSRALALNPSNPVITTNRRLLDGPQAAHPHDPIGAALAPLGATLDHVEGGAVLLNIPGDPRPEFPAPLAPERLGKPVK